ncbi:MAG: NapC/NirT family cytochrome c [Phaeospirillum sp.]|nr:NapC/NirT family cytochrome c [Phaeospirillum sp.]
MSNDNSAEKKSLLSEWWAALSKPTSRWSLGGLLAFGIVTGVVLWGGFNWALEITNTETFCLSCHEMEQNVYREYRGTIHDSNRSGVRATCPDCHVPRPWFYKMKRKLQASNEVLHKVLGSIDTREKFEAKRIELATHVWTAMKETDSRECRNCHNFGAFDLTRQSSRARNRHSEAEQQGKTCIDCHKGVAHQLPAGAFKVERELNDTMGGTNKQ